MVAGLREWARGSYADEAAVELLVRGFGGRFVREGAPWVRPGRRPGYFWVDAGAIVTFSAALSGGERRFLAVVAALVGDRALDDLVSIVSGMDRAHLALVLAALAHTGGSHQHSDLVVTGDGSCTFVELPALVRWPASTARAA